MHIHPTLSGQLANERQREMLAQASRRRLAREVRHASLVIQRAERAPRHSPICTAAAAPSPTRHAI